MTAIRRLAAILAADVAKVRSQSICLPSRANRERHLATQLTHRLYLGEGQLWGKIARPPRVPAMAGLAETGQPLR